MAERLNVPFNLLLYSRNTFFVHANSGFFLNLVPVHFSLKGGKNKGRLYFRRLYIWVVPLLDSLDVFLLHYRGNRTCVFSNVIDGNLRYLHAPQGTNSPSLPHPLHTCFPSSFFRTELCWLPQTASSSLNLVNG